MSKPKSPKPQMPIVLLTVQNCNDCGACCLHMGYPSYILETNDRPAEDAWVQMPENLKQELLRHIASYKEPTSGELDGACVWYDADLRRCKHHEHRPNVCRDFQVGSADCLGWREHYREMLA